MRKTKMGIMMALLLMAIGFAAITTNLVINGTISIGLSNNSFENDVIFTNASAESGADATISKNGKSITFNTSELKTLNQTSVLNFEITNKNRQYDATGIIECEMVDRNNQFNDYISVTANPSEFEILATEKVSGTVTVRLEKSFIGTDTSDAAEVEFICTMNVNGIERDSEINDTPITTIPNEPDNNVTVISGTGENVGDEIAIGTEHFYVLENDGANVKMLAKYNLMVGEECTYDNTDKKNTCNLLENPSNMQDSEMVGWTSNYYDGTISKGVTAFASGYDESINNYGRYWEDNTTIDLSHPNNIVGGYISNYVSKLNNLYEVNATGTLITKGEIEKIVGQTLENGDKILEIEGVPEWLYITSYWTRSSYEAEFIWNIHSNGEITFNIFNNIYNLGVRPVITISSALLK